MNIKLERQPEEHGPVNNRCPWRGCESNIQGYCQGNMNLIEDNFQYETKSDGWMVHEALTCSNYKRRGECSLKST